jgi:hypothetical protein
MHAQTEICEREKKEERSTILQNSRLTFKYNSPQTTFRILHNMPDRANSKSRYPKGKLAACQRKPTVSITQAVQAAQNHPANPMDKTISVNTCHHPPQLLIG